MATAIGITGTSFFRFWFGHPFIYKKSYRS